MNDFYLSYFLTLFLIVLLVHKKTSFISNFLYLFFNQLLSSSLTVYGFLLILFDFPHIKACNL